MLISTVDFFGKDTIFNFADRTRTYAREETEKFFMGCKN